MQDTCVAFFDEAPVNLQQKYAVIITRYGGKLLWCRHQLRHTWELPGGHIECGETALAAAGRELQEETGAVDFVITPLCWYSVFSATSQPHSIGLLCVADVTTLASLQSEIAEVQIFDTLPEQLTYPTIQPRLLEEAFRRGVITQNLSH